MFLQIISLNFKNNFPTGIFLNDVRKITWQTHVTNKYQIRHRTYCFYGVTISNIFLIMIPDIGNISTCFQPLRNIVTHYIHVLVCQIPSIHQCGHIIFCINGNQIMLISASEVDPLFDPSYNKINGGKGYHNLNFRNKIHEKIGAQAHILNGIVQH